MSSEIAQPEDSLTNTKNQTFISEDSKKFNDSMRSPKSNPSFSKKTLASHLEDIFQEPKRPTSGKVDIEKRFYEYKDKVNKKIENLKQQKEAEDKELCTFQPKTSLQPSENLKFSHFLSHMETVNETKKKNLEKRKLEKEEEEAKLKASYFKPTLTKKTQKIVSKHKSSSDLHEKLFKESEELKKKKETESQALLKQVCSFKPEVDKKSKGLKREGKTTQRLYEEGMKKKGEKGKDEEEGKRLNENFVNEESRNIMREKFLKDIEEAFIGEEFGFSEFLTVLGKCGFFKDRIEVGEEEKTLALKAWKTFEETEESKSSAEKIKTFLLNLMNLSKPDQSDSLKTQKAFAQLYDNRKSKQNKPDEPQNPEKTFTFKPKINSISKDLAKTVKSKRLTVYSSAKPEVVLNLISKEEKKQIDKKREKIESEDLKPCTFKPVTYRGPKVKTEDQLADNCSLSTDYLKILSEKDQHRCDLLYNFSKLEQEKKSRTMRSVEDYDLEKNMTECTFTPNLEKKLEKPETPQKSKLKPSYKSPPLKITNKRKPTFIKQYTGVSNSSDGQSYLADMIKNFLDK